MNILINCPSKLNIKSNGLKKIGGIESLNIALAKKLASINFNITFSTLSNSSFKIKRIINLPIKNIKFKKNNFKFDLIISSNDATIFNFFPKAKKILWLHFLRIVNHVPQLINIDL